MDKAPNGIWSSFPALWASIAWFFSILSSCLCAFVVRNVSLNDGVDDEQFDNGGGNNNGNESILLLNQGIGFWGWSSSEGTCYSYTINNTKASFDSSFKAASAFTTITDALGGFIVVCLLLGTVFPVIPKHYEYLGYASFLMAVFDFSTLAILGSNVCAPGFFQYSLDDDRPLLDDITTTSCGLGLGSIMAIMAGLFWIVVAFTTLRSPLASRSREPGKYRGNIKDGANDDDGANDNNMIDDEANRIQNQRKAENDERYRRLMGEDAESIDEEGQPGFKSLRTMTQPLSLVKEEDYGDDSYIERRKSDQSNHQQGYNHDDDVDVDVDVDVDQQQGYNNIIDVDQQGYNGDQHDDNNNNNNNNNDQHSETRSQYSEDLPLDTGHNAVQHNNEPAARQQQQQQERFSDEEDNSSYDDDDDDDESIVSEEESIQIV